MIAVTAENTFEHLLLPWKKACLIHYETRRKGMSKNLGTISMTAGAVVLVLHFIWRKPAWPSLPPS